MSEDQPEPRWISLTVAAAIHADQVEKHGGSLGLRDPGLLESALDRPRNRWHYDPESDLAQLAAAYGIGLAKNHPFIDGNKRVAFQVMYAFLRMNGLRITASEPDVVALMLSVAGGELDEQSLVEWIRSNTEGR